MKYKVLEKLKDTWDMIKGNFVFKNILMISWSLIVVVIFVWIFCVFYENYRQKPSYKDLDIDVKVIIKNEHDKSKVLEESNFEVVTFPLRIDNTVSDTDYSSFLVAFVSVLATFVVVANFANAKDLSNAANDAKKAKIKVETLGKEVENSDREVKDNLEKTKKIEQSLNDLKSALDATFKDVKSSQEKLDDSVQNASQKVSEEVEGTIREISNKIKAIETDKIELFSFFEALKAESTKLEFQIEQIRLVTKENSEKIANVQDEILNFGISEDDNKDNVEDVTEASASNNVVPPSNIVLANN